MKHLKQRIHVWLRALRDAMGHDTFSLPRSEAFDLPYSLSLTQPFTASATLEQKKHNLRIAGERIVRHTIMPGEVFSFWRAVGNPNTSQFMESRSIIAGCLQLERGGGLCQASGIIHHLALMAGLEIVERHNHSVDLYTEETRFCPLGSDATVSYGYKDLRVRNSTTSPIRFELIVGDDCFEARLLSGEPIEKREITFERSTDPDGTLVAKTIDGSSGAVIAVSRYHTLQ